MAVHKPTGEVTVALDADASDAVPALSTAEETGRCYQMQMGEKQSGVK